MNRSQLSKLYLKQFWDKVGPRGARGKNKSQHIKLYMLKRYSELDISSKINRYKEKREAFNNSRTKRYIHVKSAICFVCGHKPHCRHHIILLKHGGMNIKKNFVLLCSDCHAKIHDWL